eukprot:COSAG06_NODE_3953_length_4727_cov_1.897796_1_plen_606_part_10
MRLHRAAARSVAPEEGSAAEDKASLLEFKVAGDTDGDLASWEEATEPCSAEGWDSYSSGWHGVQCDTQWGRVTRIHLFDKDGLLGSVEALATITQLSYLSLDACGSVSGDVGSLTALAQPTYLSLYQTSVSGSVELLVALPGLTVLHLSETDVRGAAATIQAGISELNNWGSNDMDFSACSAYSSSCPEENPVIVNPDAYVGRDPCACCEGYGATSSGCVPSSGNALRLWRRTQDEEARCTELLDCETIDAGIAALQAAGLEQLAESQRQLTCCGGDSGANICRYPPDNNALYYVETWRAVDTVILLNEVNCGPGYYGTAAVTCEHRENDENQFLFSGCNENECAPLSDSVDNIDRYDLQASFGVNLTSMIPEDFGCAPNFHPQTSTDPVIRCDEHEGGFEVSGCVISQCEWEDYWVPPADVPSSSVIADWVNARVVCANTTSGTCTSETGYVVESRGYTVPNLGGVVCGPGYYGTAVATCAQQEPWGPFMFQGCTKCPAGTYNSVYGITDATDCIDCAAGTYVDVSGSVNPTDCVSCAPGRYVSDTGSDEATDCIECSAGQYSTIIGSISADNCIDCVAGKYVEVAGSDQEADCIDCLAGKYSTT